MSPSLIDSSTEILEVHTTHAWNESDTNSTNDSIISHHSHNDVTFSAWQRVRILLEIIFIPLIITYVVIGIPLVDPHPGIKNNWRFIIISFLSTYVFLNNNKQVLFIKIY